MSIAIRYSNAFSEVYEILKYLDKEDYKKISNNFLNTVENNRNRNYLYSINKEKQLKEQEMMPETKAILFNIFRDYLSTEEQKQKIKKWQMEEIEKIEKNKENDYDMDVFKIKRNQNENISVEEMHLIEVKKQNIWQKIIKRIKKLFKKI